MQTSDIEKIVKNLTDNFDKDNFIYDFLIAFGFTKMYIKRLREGNSNLSRKENQLIIKQKLFYELVENGDIYSIIENLKNDKSTYAHKPRFIVVQNIEHLLAIDTKTKETLDSALPELYKNIDFFLPWTGKEKYIAHQENPADVKAAEKMARIYDEIVKENPDLITDKNHVLNVFLTRLLFCFFAEDTNIFEDSLFTETLSNHTNEDGSDLSEFLELLFTSLDEKDKSKYPMFIQKFPYVNGNLFKEKSTIPVLTAKVRELIIECGEQDWKEINPDIFGSMFQAVATAEVRSGLGQHYTSVPNIMKVIEPLFLNDLREEFEKADTDKKLKNLLKRIYNIKIFDPACGSGNFLIIAYKQLRLLEMDIIQKIFNITAQTNMMFSNIQLNHFYGIELDDFACEIARLSLWLAEHQMNVKFRELFGDCKPTLPLSESGKIVQGNATRLDWEKVCPKRKYKTIGEISDLTIGEITDVTISEICGKDEIYILGNPPYEGARKQLANQKEDMKIVFKNSEEYKDSDYIACWFIKAANYATHSNVKFAFVSTNSICQGEQVSYIWNRTLIDNLEISFAYQSFKWTNNAKNNAGVTCVIVGVAEKNSKLKKLYTNIDLKLVQQISPYLTEKNDIIIPATKIAISSLPPIMLGNMARDGGYLILNKAEYNSLIEKYPIARSYIKRLYGSQEFIKGNIRYCLWLDDSNKNEAIKIPEIKTRIQNVYNFRINSKAKTTNQYAKVSYRFAQRVDFKQNVIIIPSTSSERRTYIPMGFLGKDAIVTNSALAIYDAEPWVFGVVTSRMHMVWVRAVAGRLKTDYRYSAELCYNTFPFPHISDKQKKIIEMHVDNILAEREKHSDKTMAELYDPDKMPESLRQAHHNLDIAIELCYKKRPFDNDEQRLEYLFKMYEIMTNPTKSNNNLEQLSLL